MVAMLIALLVSFAVTALMVRLSKRRLTSASDHDTDGPQKFHVAPVPRVGGVGIVAAVAAGVGVMAWRHSAWSGFAALVLVCGLPAFGAGIVEDFTKTMSPRRRLFFTAVSAALAAWLVDAVINRTDIPGLDWVVSIPLLAMMVTVFVVAGVANALNIIDGFNGLASMCAVMMLLAVGYVAFEVNDRALMLMALIGVGALLGFFVWNFPAGLIFLGDGGAYFVGFYVAELAILLLHRNPSVSPMFPLLVCFYPVFETLFSIYRRRVIRGQPVGMPDGVHLHSLIYRRFLRWAAGSRTARELTRRNSMTSPYLWILCMLSVVPAVLWWDNTLVLASFIVLFALSYVLLYWRIVRFQAPRWIQPPRRARRARRAARARRAQQGLETPAGQAPPTLKTDQDGPPR
jgi:UDP-N-acetylmuramyl pentapeptide phosphotransferase/UDP-N-acetylglucosamine-1-phosphate transferase